MSRLDARSTQPDPASTAAGTDPTASTCEDEPVTTSGGPLGWVRFYRRGDFPSDLIAGATVAALMIPQSMAYVAAAGFPAVTGIYASIVPLLIYALVGRSPVLAVGPLISMNLIVASGVGRIADPSSPDYVGLAVTVAVLSGVIHIAAWLTRLARLAAKVTDIALDGYLLGAAVVIIVSQLDNLLGLTDRHLDPWATLAAIPDEWSDILPVGVAFGAATFVLMVLAKRHPRFPGALLAVVTGITGVAVLGLTASEVATVGPIPSGLPLPSLPSLDHVWALLPTALACVLLSSVEIQALERRFGPDDEVPPSELGAMGAANLASSAFGGGPVTAVPTRTAVAEAAGAKTKLTGVVAAVTAFAVLAVGTAVLADLPLPVLAAIAITAAIAFFRFRSWKRALTERPGQAVLGLAVAAITITLGFEVGIGAVVVASVIGNLTADRSDTADGDKEDG
ncbi:MAG: SulP family inorganic anion transporter [Acidimicrobiia bacterium]|nr:SulP family inorganic anion transporter [Acidimicrobiia bacterium]